MKTEEEKEENEFLWKLSEQSISGIWSRRKYQMSLIGQVIGRWKSDLLI